MPTYWTVSQAIWRRLLGTLSAKDWAKLEEIRLLAQRPILLYQEGGSTFLTPSGAFTNSAERAVFVTIQQIATIFRQLCENSVYAKEEDIRQGFLSLPGGHRAGICGSATVHNGEVTFIKNISALNIRIAHQAIGCASGVMQHICSGGMLHNTILVSPPGGGKTTLLRDIARILGATYKVGIADERGEIAAVYKGEQAGDGSRFVWTVRGDSAVRTAVTTGRLVNDGIVLTGGVAAGDRVVVDGMQKIGEGSKVTER